MHTAPCCLLWVTAGVPKSHPESCTHTHTHTNARTDCHPVTGVVSGPEVDLQMTPQAHQCAAPKKLSQQETSGAPWCGVQLTYWQGFVYASLFPVSGWVLHDYRSTLPALVQQQETELTVGFACVLCICVCASWLAIMCTRVSVCVF